jgi:hypothetical protein
MVYIRYISKAGLQVLRMPYLLTDTKINKTKPREKPFKLTDGEGMYLQVNPSGSKLWSYQYRFKGIPKLMALGAYPDVSLV